MHGRERELQTKLMDDEMQLLQAQADKNLLVLELEAVQPVDIFIYPRTLSRVSPGYPRYPRLLGLRVENWVPAGIGYRQVPG